MLFRSLAGKDRKTQLAAVNEFMNRASYIEDLPNWGVPDYWATPLQFLTKDGDCEDYAIAKFVSLRTLGFTNDELRIAVVDDADAVIDAADAVYVCTWTAAHPELVGRVAAAGRAVFCEKPLATTEAVARAMVGTVEAAGVVNQVGLVLRSVPGFALVRAMLRRPESGRLSTVVFRDDQDIPVGNVSGSTWRADRDKAGAGTLLEHSIHDVDLLRWLLGDPQRVSATVAERFGYAGIDDVAAVSFAFPDGVSAQLTSVWHQVTARESSRRLEVFCEDALLWTEEIGRAHV